MEDSFHESDVAFLYNDTLTKATLTSEIIDLAGYESCAIYISLGDMTNAAGTSDTLAVHVYHAKDGDDTMAAEVEATAALHQVIVDETMGATIKAASGSLDKTAFKYGYIGYGYRYLRVKLTSGGTNGVLGPCAVIAVLGEMRHMGDYPA